MEGSGMKVAQVDRSCLLCVDRREALSLLRLASLTLGAASTASDDARFAMELHSALLAALRDQLAEQNTSEGVQRLP